MKNRILVAVILILPFALFGYFWLHPVAEKNASAPENKPAQDAAVARALATVSPQASAVIASNFAAIRPPQNPVFTAPARNFAPAGTPAPLEFTKECARIVVRSEE